ncbi:MAG: endonuclease/exonuclease/phosphatase family protein, partial [Planctomycetales bacterium]|nr:endonuclease/exonuclease/phosphatase family protein [Planctomycetales bacterium]
VNGQTLHVLASHPTPPVFDGPEDRNGRRNHDEIRFWADYVTPGKNDYIVDDMNVSGGLSELASFVVLGDQNADPTNGDSVSGAIDQLLNAERVNGDFVPTSANHGALTASFNLRVDYVLPSNDLEVVDGAVFWPQSPDTLARLSLVSDHRLVWLDVQMVPEPNNAVWLMVVAVWTLRRSSTCRFGRNGSDEIASGRS